MKDVPHATDPAQSSKILRQLCKTELLKFTDMRDNPEKFFMAHRLLSTVGLGGFGIRFTVQFNLFAGSLVGLAGEEQLKMLDEIQKEGKLGCFLLTEMLKIEPNLKIYGFDISRYAIKKSDFYDFETDILDQFKDLIEIESYGDKL